jgi:hypothetical protein
MPEVVSCPKCQRRSRVPDALVGKRVKCPGCGEIFTAAVGGAASPARQPAAAKTRPGLDTGAGYELVDDEDERLTDKPPARRGRDTDEEDEDERPRRSRRSRDDEDDDERVGQRRNRYRRDRDDDDDADENEEDRPAAPRRGVAADWPRVRLGLSLLLASVLLQVGLFFYRLIAQCAVNGMGPQPNAPGAMGNQQGQTVAMALAILGLVGALIAWILKAGGGVLCLGSPSAHRTRTWAVVGLGLMGADAAFTTLLFVVVAAMFGVSAMLDGGANPFVGGLGPALGGVVALGILALLMMLAQVAWYFAIGIYLRCLGLALRNYSLAGSARGWLITLGGTVGLGLLAVVVAVATIGLAGLAINNQVAGMNAGKPQGPGMAGAGLGGGLIVTLGLGCIVLILWLVLVVWYIVMLGQARGAIGLRRARF